MISNLRKFTIAAATVMATFLVHATDRLPELGAAKPISYGQCAYNNYKYMCVLVELDKTRYIVVVDSVGILVVAQVKESAGNKPDYKEDEMEIIYERPNQSRRKLDS